MASLISTKRLLSNALNMRKAFPVSITRSLDTAAVIAQYNEKKEKALAELNEELPKPYDGPERDLVNFPRRKRLEEPGKVRFAFLPDEWFTFFYKKTGVTGPYVFGAGLITFLLSKEWYVIDEETSTGCAQIILMYLFAKKVGPHIKNWILDVTHKDLQERYDTKAANVKALEDGVQQIKKNQSTMAANDLIVAAKRDNVLMQLETEYRRRLMDVFQQVKKRLDFQVEIDTTRKQMEQKHMVEWIVSNVIKSITPQQEKEALQKCLLDLKTLASKA